MAWVISSHLRFLSSLPLHVRLTSIKTLVGGWTTSARMHEAERLPCFFGCRASCDDLPHYLLCRRLQRSVEYATKRPLPDSILARLGLDNDIACVCCLSVAFTTYHTVSNKYKTEIVHALRSWAFETLAAHVKGEADVAYRHICKILPSIAATSPAPNGATESRFVTAVPAVEVPIRATEARSAFATAGSRTTFVQGGDHFMTTSFS